MDSKKADMNAPPRLMLLLLLLGWSIIQLNGTILVEDNLFFPVSLLQEGEAAGPWRGGNTTKSPIQEVIELAGSLHMTDIEGQAFCRRTFPNARIPLYYVEDRIVHSSATYYPTRKIPKMIHMTSESRCLSKPLFDNINTWKKAFPDYSLFMHDGQARERFFRQANDDAERHLGFPYMAMIRPCLKDSGATLSDVWRYMFLFQYGGMYVDFDDGPGDLLRTTIDQFPRSQAMVIQHLGKIIAQSFFMVSPRHPLMQFALLQSFVNLLSLRAVGAQYIPYTTGPQALGKAYHKFMGIYGVDPPLIENRTFWKAGHHVGHGNWSVDVIAGYKQKGDFLKLYVVDEDQKKGYYAAVNGKDYERRKHRARADRSDLTSCFGKIVDNLASNMV